MAHFPFKRDDFLGKILTFASSIHHITILNSIYGKQKTRHQVQPRIKNKGVIVDLFVLWLALTALSCAAINLHISLNKLEPKEEE